MWTEEKELQAKLWAERFNDYPLTRHSCLEKAGAGFGLAALGCLFSEEKALGQDQKSIDPLAPRRPHFPAKAKSVIGLFMAGGPSHIDTFDPKPLLHKLAGQKMPESFGSLISNNAGPSTRRW